MSIRRINPDDVEHFTLETHPRRTYSSGSAGVSGSLYVFPRRSSLEKEVQPLSFFSSSAFSDQDLGQFISLAQHFSDVSGVNTPQLRGYLGAVYDQQPSARKQQQLEIVRFTPPFRMNTNTMRKLVTVNTIMPFYRDVQPNSHFAVSNYNSLNFFTGSQVSEATAILYPNPNGGQYPTYGRYTPTGSWSFDFWINPKYTTDAPGGAFKAGTIMHLSGVFAVSLVSGSSKDINGYLNGYRLMVQLSSSAGVLPSLATTGALTFLSSDNSLRKNHWHHVTIRHGGPAPLYNNGTGSIVIDNHVDTNFVLTTGIASSTPTGGYGARSPSVMVVGNFYEGTNFGASNMDRFFGRTTAETDGLIEISSDPATYPTTFNFRHPLNAEIHDLKIFNKYLTSTEVSGYQSSGPQSLQNVLFYVPPFFTETSPTRDVLLTPFQSKTDTTKDAFNISMSFGVGGMYMNLENYGMELTTGHFPRWLNLTGSEIPVTTDALTANEFLFATASNRRRQYTVMPCDNGQFVPNFFLLNTASLPTNKYRNDLGNVNFGIVSLRDLAPLADPAFGLQSTGSLVDSMVGASPDNLSGSFSDSMAILHRTRDNTSNQVVFFDISNLYYGNQIKPGSLVVRDASLSGSGGKISVTLKDDGYGNIYRADCLTPQATWSSVGNVFYNEGIVLLKAPQLSFFGISEWEMEFSGHQNLHVLKFNLVRPPLTSTSSSNPAYLPIPSSDLANETDEKFVWLSGIYLHDDNLNIVSKTNLAQTVQMRTGDKMMFKVKMDF